MHVQDATLVTSSEPARVRLSLILYDTTVNEAQQRPRFFAWVPCLRLLLLHPNAHHVGSQMQARLWTELHRQHYHPSDDVRARIEVCGAVTAPWGWRAAGRALAVQCECMS